MRMYLHRYFYCRLSHCAQATNTLNSTPWRTSKGSRSFHLLGLLFWERRLWGLPCLF